MDSISSEIISEIIFFSSVLVGSLYKLSRILYKQTPSPLNNTLVLPIHPSQIEAKDSSDFEHLVPQHIFKMYVIIKGS
jgi:hypothetical protein